jgi:putative transposase
MSRRLRGPRSAKSYRFPPEIISHCVWLYYCARRLRTELARGIEVSYEAIRLWTLPFGLEYARRLRRTRGACLNIWHLSMNSV